MQRPDDRCVVSKVVGLYDEAPHVDGGRQTRSDTVIGTTLNQRFTLDKELGRGGMGSVYRATDQVLQRTVAIKVLRERADDEVGRKIRLEAQILARLLHENIVRLYDFGEADGTYYFVMEEVDGPELRPPLEADPPGRAAPGDRPDRRRAGLRAPPGGDPPRRQAGQRAADLGRTRPSSRTSGSR